MSSTQDALHFMPVRTASLRDGVRIALYEAIRGQRLRPGDRLIESRLAREMGVSQSVVREALRELEQMGLVESFRNRGAYVRRVSRAGAQEIYSLRALLERYAVELAIPRLRARDMRALERHIEQMAQAARAGDERRFVDADGGFHRAIVAAADHHLLLRSWESINLLSWTLTPYLRLTDNNPCSLADRHRPILEALRAGDVTPAQQELERHTLELVALMLPHIEEC